MSDVEEIAPLGNVGDVIEGLVAYSVEEIEAACALWELPVVPSVVVDIDEDRTDEARDAAVEAGLRALIARRALMVSAAAGTDTGGEMELLEPHATILGAVVAPRTSVIAQRWDDDRFEQRSFYVAEDLALEESTLGYGVHDFTFFAMEHLSDRVIEFLQIEEREAPDAEAAPFECTGEELAAWESGEGPTPSAGTRSKFVDALTNAITRSRVLMTRSIAESTVEVEEIIWIDGGSRGTWRVDTAFTDDAPDDAERAQVAPATADELRSSIRGLLEG